MAQYLDRTKDLIIHFIEYIENRRLLLSIADAGGRLMYAYKDLLELAGLTTRVYTLISTLHALPPVREFTVKEDEIAFDGVSICVPERTLRNGGTEKSAQFSLDDADDENLGLGGTDGSLMDPLRLVIKRGEHLMITGPVRWLPGRYFSGFCLYSTHDWLLLLM